MSEDKRFINDVDNGKLVDTKRELFTIHYYDSVDFYELCEFLNRLDEENEQLKQDDEKYRKLSVQLDNRNKELVSENVLLEKENEQLKQSNTQTLKEFRKMTKRITELANENEQLKTELSEKNIQLDYLQSENKQMSNVLNENKQLKQLIKRTLETTPIKHELAIELKNSVRELYD